MNNAASLPVDETTGELPPDHTALLADFKLRSQLTSYVFYQGWPGHDRRGSGADRVVALGPQALGLLTQLTLGRGVVGGELGPRRPHSGPRAVP